MARVPIAEGNLHKDMNGGATTELTATNPPLQRCRVRARTGRADAGSASGYPT